MNTALVGSDVVDLLSRITTRRLSQRDLTPPVIFLASLIAVLRDVAKADGIVTDEELQRWQATLRRFVSRDINQLTQLMSLGMRQYQVFAYSPDFLTLTAPLSKSERLLLIGLGYEMSAADGDLDGFEKQYLKAVANIIGIDRRCLAVLEAGFSGGVTVDLIALDEVHSLLDPTRYLQKLFFFAKVNK